MHSQHFRQSILPSIFLLVLIPAILWSFWPGLGGSLIFDDIPNLRPWSDIGDIHTWQQVFTFSLSGNGLPGRPLSLLSFLLDDQSWSPDVFSLKRTNLAIHLLNTCFIFWLTLKLLPTLLPKKTENTAWLALFVSALWALHPLQVSNVSYIIQRMNLLSTLLELIGLLIFFTGRSSLPSSPKRAIIICSIGIGIFMPLAILAKENGLLLCAFALLVEAFCFPSYRQPVWRIWKALFLWLPLLAFFAYCLISYKGFTTGYELRNFNAWERLLTQGPVLLDYLNKLLIPRLYGSGLYFDNFPVSHSFLNPISTALSWIFLITLISIAYWQKKRHPLFSFGILFYFTGHLMESTLIPLELYFEHRNYLPQYGLWLALIGLLILIPTRLTKITVIFAFILITLLILMTRNNATLWGDPDRQAAVWYHENPSSLRSATDYVNLLLLKGDFPTLNAVLARMQSDHPNKLITSLSIRYIHCYWQGIPVSFTELAPLARKADYESASLSMLGKMRALAIGVNDPFAPKEKGCQFASLSQIAILYQALLENPHFKTADTRTQLFEYLAEIATEQHQLDSAIHYYSQAFAESKNPIYPYRQALLLQSASLPADAFKFAHQSEQALNFKYRHLYPDLVNRIPFLQRSLLKEIQHP